MQAQRGGGRKRGTLGSGVVNACFFPQWPRPAAILPARLPICDSLWFVGGLSAALSQRTPWNFWIILHCLFTKRRVGEVEGKQGQGQGEGQGQRKRRLQSVCPHVRKLLCTMQIERAHAGGKTKRIMSRGIARRRETERGGKRNYKLWAGVCWAGTFSNLLVKRALWQQKITCFLSLSLSLDGFALTSALSLSFALSLCCARQLQLAVCGCMCVCVCLLKYSLWRSLLLFLN